jgi:hypothetical protein
MQVKCVLRKYISSTVMPDSVADDIEREGSAILAKWVSPPPNYGDNIVLSATDFGGAFNSSVDPSRKKAPKRCDALFILGGRQSIVSWLRLQGKSPKVCNATGNMELHATVLRKRRRFDKDLTMVVIHPYGDMPLQEGDWKATASVDLRNSPEAPRSQHTGDMMGEFAPMQLASIMERLFMGLPW